MTIANKLSDIRIIGNTLEIHCVETLDDGRVIGHWRTTLQKGSDLTTVAEHCTAEDLVKIQAHLALVDETVVGEA